MIAVVVSLVFLAIIVALIALALYRRRRYIIERAEDYEKRNECKYLVFAIHKHHYEHLHRYLHLHYPPHPCLLNVDVSPIHHW